jgi:AcrR family transcriptional regulator
VALTKERIVEEAARLFNRYGYRGTTLDLVARALGVTRPALYYHVKSKEELLFQCYALPIQIGLDGIQRAVAASPAPEEQLRLALEHYITGITDQLSGSVVMLEERTLSAAHRQQVIAWRDEYERQLRGILARGIECDVFVRCNPKIVGFALLGAGNWIPKWYNPGGASTGKEVAAIFSRFLVRGLTRHRDENPIEPVCSAGRRRSCTSTSPTSRERSCMPRVTSCARNARPT